MPAASSPQSSSGDLRPQVVGRGGRGGMVEDQGRRQPQPGGHGEAVPELDRAQRVEAELLEGPLGVHRLGGGMPEHRGHVGSHLLEHRPVPLGLGQAGEAPRQRAPGIARPAGGGADEAAQERRQRPDPGHGPQGGGVQAHRDQKRLLAGAGGVEELEALLGRQRLHARAPQPRQAGLAQVGGHAAGLGPKPPGQGARGKTPGAAALGERVEEGVGGGVVALAGGAEGGGGRGEQHELGELQPGGELVQVKGGVELRAQHPVDPLGVERLDHAVVEHASGVDHRAQRVLLGDRVDERRQLVSVGDVAGREARLTTEP